MYSIYSGIKLISEITTKNCHHVLTSSTLQNGTFHVVERTRTAAKCTPVKITRAKLNHCFSLFTTQIYDVLVAIAVVVANNMAIISKATCFSL